MADEAFERSAVNVEITVLPGPVLHLAVKNENEKTARILKVTLNKKTALNIAFSLLRKVVLHDDSS